MEKTIKQVAGTLVGIIALPIIIIKVLIWYWQLNNFLLVNLVDTTGWEEENLFLVRFIMLAVGLSVPSIIGLFFGEDEPNPTPNE